MKLNQVKIYSPVMMLGVLSILNGCNSKEGTMTNNVSQVEYDKELEESDNSTQLNQGISIEEVYDQAANVLLEMDKNISDQEAENSTKNMMTSSIEAVENINEFADLLQKYKDSFAENKKYVQEELKQINIKENIAKALEYIISNSQENDEPDKMTLKNIMTENNQTKLVFKNNNSTKSYILRPTTEEMYNVVSIFWGSTEETIGLSKEEGSQDYYNFLSLFIPTLEDFATNIDNYKISISQEEYLKEDTTYYLNTGIIYNQNQISDQINCDIQEALDMVKEQYCKTGETSLDYEIRENGDTNGWIIRNKNNSEDYMILEGKEESLINTVGELQPITPEMIADYNTVKNIVILDNAKQAYQAQTQSRK